MSAKRKIKLPTLEEDAAINLGIALDPDTMEVSNQEFPKLKPFHGRVIEKKDVSLPQTAPLDADGVAAFPA